MKYCNECCDKCGKCCGKCCDGCSKKCCKNEDDAECIFYLILFLLAIIIVIFIIYMFCFGTYVLTEKCGKHLSRYIVLIFISFINLGIYIICYLLVKKEELIIYIIMGVSGTITLLNVLSMLITNIICC